jgi:cation:H+ antiporter
MITALQITGGLLLLFLGGEMLVRGAVDLAKKLGLPVFVIGLTVVAYGTSSPEMVISIQAALGGHSDIALGNVVGSNISNILCVLGLTAIVSPILIDKKLSLFDCSFMLGVTVLLYLFCVYGNLGKITGLTFIVILII